MAVGDVAGTGGRSPSASSWQRAAALGSELVEVHQWLRQWLHELRTDLDSPDGRATVDLRSLRAHCAGFCAALTRHHTSEDQTAFPLLADEVPELAAVLQELQRDHHLISAIVRRVEQLAAVLSTDNAQRARSELDGLAAILESHFRWEERKLAGALNSLHAPGTNSVDLFGLPSPPR
jgi:hemerythrin-like domain-containing protein